MKITWLGQAGLLFERDGFSVMIDPYLSDYVAKVEPQNVRRVPVDERFFDVDPDVMIFTHDHIDHYDPETAPIFFKKTKKRMSVLGPISVRKKAMGDLCGQNYILFNRHTSVSLGGFVFTAVKAAHSDPDAVGVIIEDTVEGKTYYVAGDTLYNSEIFGDLPEHIDAVFMPINGVGNNMNMTDAARFAKRTGAKVVVPLHFGLFDGLNPQEFECENKVIPEFWKEIEV